MNPKWLLLCLLLVSFLSIANEARAVTKMWQCGASIREGNGKVHKAYTKARVRRVRLRHPETCR
jgi:hypothetical protein